MTWNWPGRRRRMGTDPTNPVRQVRRGVSLGVETLERRDVPAVYLVTGTMDGPGVIAPDGLGGFTATTLRGAIIDANANAGADTIRLPATGELNPYVLSVVGFDDTAAAGDLDILGDLTIQGGGAGGTIIDADLIDDRVFHILPGFNVTISDVTIRNGLAPIGDSSFGDAVGGGIYNDRSTLLLQRVVIRDNQAIGSDVTDFFAEGGSARGGGIFNYNGDLTIVDSEIRDNLAQGGRGDSLGSFFGFGGDALGGGLSTLSGAVSEIASTVLVQNSTLAGNQAVGGIGTSPEEAAIGGSAEGGGIHNQDSFLTVSNSTVSTNRVQGGDAFITEDSAGVAFGGEGQGGGIYDDRNPFEGNAPVTRITNTTITLNEAIGGNGDVVGDAEGGGLYSSGNDVEVGGLSSHETEGAIIGSTIIAGNTVTPTNFDNGPDVFTELAINTLDFNLIGIVDGSTGFDGANDQTGTGAMPIDAQLLPLALNPLSGRPLPLTRTHALNTAAGLISPAIDSGATYLPPPLLVPLNDQRGTGYKRSAGPQTDVGAYEVQDGSLAGFVYRDLNNNGAFETDLGETGIASVTISLTGTDFLGVSVNLETMTDAAGAYIFSDLRISDVAGYTITEFQPAGFADGNDTQGTPGTGTTGSDVFSGITLSEGVNGANNNFGELVAPATPPAIPIFISISISKRLFLASTPAGLGSSQSGFVYLDVNQNGARQAGEPGVSNTTVTLAGITVTGQVLLRQAQTDATGFYVFPSLAAGFYSVIVTAPSTCVPVQATAGNFGGNAGADRVTSILIPANASGTGYNFGLGATASSVRVTTEDLLDEGLDSGLDA